MRKEDKIELVVTIVLGFFAIATLFFMGSMAKPVAAGIFSLCATGCFFFGLSFSQRHHRNKET